MKRIKLDDRVLPKYTKGEEVFNMVTHIVGGGLGVIAFILCLIKSIIHANAYSIISSIIYGVFTITLYTMSSIYHGLNPKLKGKKVLQILDHCTIFVYIAGCYTPFCLITFREYDIFLGWGMFAFVWISAILGVVFNSIDLRRYRVLSMLCYLSMGWCIILKINILPSLISIPGFILLLSGGIVYTLGAILYGVGTKIKYIHSIFHMFIVLASILQFLCIYLYVI